MTATTDVVISEKSMLEFFRSDFSGIAVSRISTMRIGWLLYYSLRPHPEERSEGPRLEGWRRCPCFEMRTSCAPQHEVVRRLVPRQALKLNLRNVGLLDHPLP